MPEGAGLSAPDVILSYTLNGQAATADIKAINVTPANNSTTLDLTSLAVGAYNFSYLTPQPSGAGGETIILPTAQAHDVIAYTNTSDSVPGGFDTIQNFDPASDKLDFSEIPGITSFHNLGTLSAVPSGTPVGAHSITWFIDSATSQTIVYVNPTSVAESAAAASMEVVLAGKKTLSSTNFVHSEPALTLTVSQSSISVAGSGGSTSLSISVSNYDFGDNVSVTIGGLASYESVTDTLDGNSFTGASITLSAAEVNSGLTLHSSFSGTGHPVNTLTVTATNSTPGETSETTAPKTIKVTDPPPKVTSSGLSLLMQFAAVSGSAGASGSSQLRSTLNESVANLEHSLTKPG